MTLLAFLLFIGGAIALFSPRQAACYALACCAGAATPLVGLLFLASMADSFEAGGTGLLMLLIIGIHLLIPVIFIATWLAANRYFRNKTFFDSLRHARFLIGGIAMAASLAGIAHAAGWL